MYISNFSSYGRVLSPGAQQAKPMDQLVSMLNERSDSPLESAQRALQAAKDRLDQHRDEELEEAMEGYRALRSRQTSFEEALGVQQERMETFQDLNRRYDALAEEVSAAQTEYADYTASGGARDIAWENKLALGASALASVDQEISALVDQANRYTNAQKQYAAYLENTEQGGYAAVQYLEQPEYTRENFASETNQLIGRLETGVSQWRERVSSYCAQYGRTAYDFENYLQERHRLQDAYLAAEQRVSELLNTAPNGKDQASESTMGRVQKSQDTVELSEQARRFFML